MADIKREQEREELHRSLWKIAEELRGAVDGWDFKQYVLGIMFYRYISENLTNYINKGEHDAGDKSFDYAKMSDEEALVAKEGLIEEKGFFILPSELFCNVVKKCDDDEKLNETLEKVFNHIEESAKGSVSESDFTGLFDDIDVNSNKLGTTVEKRNKKLASVLKNIAEMKLSYGENSIDIFGDAYEYLMSMYASNAGKSGGEFFTPQEVSELLTRLAVIGKTEVNKVYDPACGSGSLLLKALKVLGKENIKQGFYGQEKNITTYNLCRINMFLHDVDFDKFNIACEDTLESPQHWDDEPFDVIVSNPPYSNPWEGNSNPLLINDSRFSPAGVLAPKKFSDFAFILHSLSWLSTDGVASIVCFPGIMRRKGVEQKIRKYLIDNNYIDCIIQLPDNLFFGTTIDTCIMLLKKSRIDTNVLFIDASNEYVKVTNNNKLSNKNIENILKLYKKRESIVYSSSLVKYEEIKNQKYDLSVSTYVRKKKVKNSIDIKSLNDEIKELLDRQNRLKLDINNFSVNIDNFLNEILNTYCPKGVEYKKLKDIAKVERGQRVTKKELIKDGKYPVISGGVKPLGYLDKYNRDKNTITIAQYGSAGYVDFQKEVFWANDVCYSVYPNEGIDNKYLYYCLCNLQDYLYSLTTKAIPDHLPIERLNDVLIPLPPLKVQSEIVKKLENFTLLTAELTAELKLREKQYKYFCNKLLTFKELK